MSEAPSPPGEARPATVRVSSGSAAVLGLESWHVEVAPTTAYLMVGDRCAHDCAFCAQARSSTARAGQLSRVSWPGYPIAEVMPSLAAAFDRGAIERCCLQVTGGPGFAARARQLVREVKAASEVPLCVSIRATDLELFAELLALGAERVTLAVDAVSEPVYRRVKGHHWRQTIDLLTAAARQYPGHVGTHIIAGLGETEAEVAGFLQDMHSAGIVTALFAFTPLPGTALAGEPPPPLASYRRIQAARFLIAGGHANAGQFRFTSEGRIASYGLGAAALCALLLSGQAFRTAGCPGCNRPYYNERPSGPLYNYPRPLRPEEAAEAVAIVLSSLASD